jgi:hypothetical protein
MSANPGVGTKGGCSWDKFLDLWHHEVKKEVKGIYGKTSEQLKRHHANEWTVKNSKLKAVMEGSDALRQLRQAVGALGRELQIDASFDNDIDAWEGAGVVVPIALPKENPLLPRHNEAHVQASLFGPSHVLTLHGRTPGRKRGVRDKHPERSIKRRQQRDCANPLCRDWRTCKGGVRRQYCPSYPEFTSISSTSSFLSRHNLSLRRKEYESTLNQN